MSKSSFKNNKYTKWYFNIITNAQQRIGYDGYTEKHHIIPKCMDGNDNLTNIVILTGREHFLVHLLLPKMVSSERLHNKLMCAIRRLRYSNNIIYNSRIYEKIKPKIVESHKKLVTGKPQRKRTDEEKVKQSIKIKEYYNNLSDEEREIKSKNAANRARKFNTGKKKSLKTCKNISNALKGKKKTIRMNKEEWLEIRRSAIKKCNEKCDRKEVGKAISKSKLKAKKKYTNNEKRNLIIGKLQKIIPIILSTYGVINDDTIHNAKERKIIPKNAQISEKTILKVYNKIPAM